MLTVENMSLPIQQQYESQMFSTIGKDNKTAVVTVSFDRFRLEPRRHQSANREWKRTSANCLLCKE